MRAILLALMLVSAPIHASYLSVKTYCGKTAYLTGTVNGVTVEATPAMITGNSDLAAFFQKVFAEIKVVNGEREFIVIPLDKLLGHTCPVSI